MAPLRLKKLLLENSPESGSLLPLRLSAGELRREVGERNLALSRDVAHETTIGATPSVLYHDVGGAHGNFLPAAYRRIRASADWSCRLQKCYSASKRVPRPGDRIRRELDCASSSDALLMNIFCYPGITVRRSMCSLLGVESGLRPQFGVRPDTPFAGGGIDRTEIDMGLGHLLIEAKLTESDFQTARPDLVVRYRDLEMAFDVDELPTAENHFHSYQLIRGVLAAHYCRRSYLVLCDSRRRDLVEDWYRVIRAVRNCDLRSRLAILTWQELSSVLPRKLQEFLEVKYGIFPAR